MRRLRPYALLFGLALVAFWPLVLHPTETLYSDHSDLLAQHIPAKYFLVRSLRETGELPLWNPEQYAGSPFVHDIQVGLFYPPNLPLYFISEPAIGPFVSWLVFLHVLLAGWFMYAYSRHAGFGELAAFVAGVGFMLSPRWMMQLLLAGHTVTQGICWLPLVLLCVERAIQRGRWSWAVGAGVAYALMILGTHPQWTFYGSLLIGAWPLRLVHERWQTSRPRQRVGEPTNASLIADYGEPGRVSARSASASREEALPELTQPGSPVSARRLLFRWFLVEVVVVMIGLGLCAVQLLPTMEAAGQSSRAKGMGQSWSLDGAKAAAGTLIGPFPDAKAEPVHWETRGGIGFTWAVLALVGARRAGRRQLVPLLIAIAMLAYVLGGSYFIDRLPGFNNFRMPTRMLLTFAFPVAWFAGLGVAVVERERSSRLLLWTSLAVLIYLVNFGSLSVVKEYRDGIIRWLAVEIAWQYWFFVLPVASCVLTLGPRCPSPFSQLFITGLVTIDILLMSGPPGVRGEEKTEHVEYVYPQSPIIDFIRDHNSEGLRAYDAGAAFGEGCPAASVHGVPTVLGYNPLDVARYRQFLAWIAGQVGTQQAFGGEFTHPVIVRLDVQNRALFDLLGVKYVIAEQEHDSWERTNWQRLDDPLFDMPTRTYSFLGAGLNVFNRKKHRLWINRTVLPHAFVVTESLAEDDGEGVLDQLKRINLARAAIIHPDDSGVPNLPQASSPPGPAKILSYKPNEIRIGLDGHTAGLLVLTDPWYPGWVCRVDGNEVPIWKADYAFRGVMVPEGSREVVFHFEPQSYRRGKWISLGTLAVVIGFFVVRVRPFLRRKQTICA